MALTSIFTGMEKGPEEIDKNFKTIEPLIRVANRDEAIDENDNIKAASLSYRRVGNIVTLNVGFNLKNDTGWISLAKVPSGFIPAKSNPISVVAGNNSTRGYTCEIYYSKGTSSWTCIPNASQIGGGFLAIMTYATDDDFPTETE